MSAALAIALLYWLPGAGLLEALCPELRGDPRHDRLSRFAFAVSLSLALRPLLDLWCKVVGVTGGEWLAWTPGVVGAALLGAAALRRRRHPEPHARRGAGIGWLDLVLALVVLLVVVSRWLSVRGLLVPAWGDSVQHAVITQLMIDHRGLFSSWEPYAPMESLSYHFGFHSMAAAWAWITGVTAPDAVLWVGQLTGVAAVLSLYPLALELTGGRRVAGLGAVLFGGLLSPMPAFYASWGRYTQVAGQAILPALVARLDAALFRRRRRGFGTYAMLAILSAGLCLTHYRVAILASVAAVVWAAGALWRWRAAAREWTLRCTALLVTLLATAALTSAWVFVLNEGILLSVYGTIVAINPSVFSLHDIYAAWSSIPMRLPAGMLVAIIAAGAVGLASRERSITLVIAWSAVSLVVTNPFVLGLPGMGFVTNFAVAIAAYIPASYVVGWGLARISPRVVRRPGGRAALAATLVLAALWGFAERSEPVAAKFQLLTRADLSAFEWIRENTPPDAHFQVETALAYGGKTAVGTDGGWWLPLFADRTSTLPPLPYTVERMSERLRHDVWAMPTWIRRSKLRASRYNGVLCVQGVTHVYLGDKRGSIGGDGKPLLPEAALRKNPKMRLLHQVGHAQVWSFDRSDCGPWGEPAHRRFRPRRDGAQSKH